MSQFSAIVQVKKLFENDGLHNTVACNHQYFRVLTERLKDQGSLARGMGGT